MTPDQIEFLLAAPSFALLFAVSFICAYGILE